MKTRNSAAEQGAGLALAGGVFLAGLACPALADVTLTLQQSAETSTASQAAVSPASGARTVMLLFHGSDARLELPGGLVLIYSGKDGTIETLHSAAKTYDMTFLAQMSQANDPLPPGAGGQVTTNMRLDLKETDQTQILAGVTAHQYLVVGSLSYTRPQPHFGRGQGMGGGRHYGGGGLPGGFPLESGRRKLDQDSGGWNDDDGSDRPRNLPPLPTFRIGGEVWLSDAVKLPDAKGATTLPAVQLAAASAGPFLQPLTDALDKKKEIPLRALVTVTRSMRGTSGTVVDAYGGVEEGGAAPAATAPTSMTTATTLNVQAVSSLPVPPSLFDAPTDYRLIAAPLDPLDPGMPDPAAAATNASAP